MIAIVFIIKIEHFLFYLLLRSFIFFHLFSPGCNSVRRLHLSGNTKLNVTSVSVGWETAYFITLEKAYGMTVTIMTIVINKIIQVGQICLISWVKQEILICVWQRKIHILSKRKNILPDSWAPDCSARGPRHLAGWSSDWRGATASFLSPSQTSQCPAKPAKQRFPHFYFFR